MTNNFTNPVNENAYESSIIELFEDMGYTHVYGPDIEDRDFYSPLYDDVLVNALYKINPKLPESAIKEALYKLKNFENAELAQKINFLWIICKTELPSAIQKKANLKIQLSI